MVNTVHSPYSREQLTAWLQGLLTIAWADGHFDEEEKKLITSLTEEELVPTINLEPFTPIAGADLAAALGDDAKLRNNFLRTAVMVALADGVYSNSEDAVLHEFCQDLGLEDEVIESLRATLYHREEETVQAHAAASPLHPPDHPDHHPKLDVLHPARDWLDGLEIHDPQLARFLCKLIPPQCPFERDVNLFGHKVVHIPPLCKLNPFYEQLVGLRFRALSYLADDCGEDVRPYC
ncbi:MAG: Mo-dependent nitrogenase C-terminal domain-containing protein [Prochlorothrix sp.]|nr:Mo-dependent nitrogenase C-terminal domain-containing protein [Prochlorothrix sp.]